MTSVRTAARWRRARHLLEGRLPLPITHVVPVEHPETAAVVRRRRRVVVAVSVLGTGLLSLSLSTKPDSRAFYATTSAVAATWTTGGVISGPLHLGWIQSRDQHLRRPIVTPIATGVGAFGFFYACALLSRRIPVLDRAIGNVLQFAEQGQGPLVVATTLTNGLGEEIFFRGAMYAAFDPAHAVVASTAVYTLTTASTRNPALMLAAGLMGTLFGLQRRASGGLQAPTLTHLTWSTLMVPTSPRCSGAPTMAGHEQPPPGRRRSPPALAGPVSTGPQELTGRGLDVRTSRPADSSIGQRPTPTARRSALAATSAAGQPATGSATGATGRRGGA